MATKVTREQIASYLNVEPSKSTPTWKIIGVGVEDYSISYNPQVNTTKWIIHKNATNSVDSMQIQGDVTQTCYFGDEVYDFINGLRRTASVGAKCESQVLDIDLYDENEGKYAATLYNCTIAVTSYGGSESAEIGYSIYYNGDPKVGTVEIAGGVPTFTESM